MRRVWLMLSLAALMVCGARSASADDELDVTMQVLEDVGGIEGVFLSVGDEAGAGRQPAEQRQKSAGAADQEGDHADSDRDPDELDSSRASTHDAGGSGRHEDGEDAPHAPAPDRRLRRAQ